MRFAHGSFAFAQDDGSVGMGVSGMRETGIGDSAVRQADAGWDQGSAWRPMRFARGFFDSAQNDEVVGRGGGPERSAAGGGLVT